MVFGSPPVLKRTSARGGMPLSPAERDRAHDGEDPGQPEAGLLFDLPQTNMAAIRTPTIGRRYARKLMSEKAKARFIEPMLLLRTEQLPDGPEWLHELKFDGYRALAIKNVGKVQLRSRKDNDFNGRYPAIVKALSAMPDETVIDGEVVALDGEAKPSFNLLQNYAAGADL